MISFEKAKAIFEEKYPNYSISSALDVGDEYVISFHDKESGEDLDSSPIAINKETGETRTFFPPSNTDKLKSAITISIDDKK